VALIGEGFATSIAPASARWLPRKRRDRAFDAVGDFDFDRLDVGTGRPDLGHQARQRIVVPQRGLRIGREGLHQPHGA
jgi:hypothetical protein